MVADALSFVCAKRVLDMANLKENICKIMLNYVVYFERKCVTTWRQFELLECNISGLGARPAIDSHCTAVPMKEYQIYKAFV